MRDVAGANGGGHRIDHAAAVTMEIGDGEVLRQKGVESGRAFERATEGARIVERRERDLRATGLEGGALARSRTTTRTCFRGQQLSATTLPVLPDAQRNHEHGLILLEGGDDRRGLHAGAKVGRDVRGADASRRGR